MEKMMQRPLWDNLKRQNREIYSCYRLTAHKPAIRWILTKSPGLWIHYIQLHRFILSQRGSWSRSISLPQAIATDRVFFWKSECISIIKCVGQERFVYFFTNVTNQNFKRGIKVICPFADSYHTLKCDLIPHNQFTNYFS